MKEDGRLNRFTMYLVTCSSSVYFNLIIDMFGVEIIRVGQTVRAIMSKVCLSFSYSKTFLVSNGCKKDNTWMTTVLLHLY